MHDDDHGALRTDLKKGADLRLISARKPKRDQKLLGALLSNVVSKNSIVIINRSSASQLDVAVWIPVYRL